MGFETPQRIGTLYEIEAEGKNLTIENRQRLRDGKSLTALSALYDWVMQTRIQNRKWRRIHQSTGLHAEKLAESNPLCTHRSSANRQ
jgi:hypothetical protein